MGQDPVLVSRYPDVAFGLNVQVLGLRETTIGPGSIVGDDTWLNVSNRDGKHRIAINRCVCVGRQAVISAATHVEIGDYVLMGPRVFIADNDHSFDNILVPYVEQPAKSRGPLVVEENCWLGTSCVISGNLTIGRGSVVAANAVVKADVPPFCLVGGVPARILRLYNPATCVWEQIRSSEDLARVQENRQAHSLPNREEYRFILKRTSKLTRIDPIAAGGGWHL